MNRTLVKLNFLRIIGGQDIYACANIDVLMIMGQVEPKKFALLSNWQREYTMEDILTQLKKEMAAPHNRKLVQPPEGTYFQCKDMKVPIAIMLILQFI